MEELSMAQKVEKLGFNSKEFWNDVEKISDLINFDYTKKNLEENVYPYLKKLKQKYGFNIPIGLFGVDVARLERTINNELILKKKDKLKEVV